MLKISQLANGLFADKEFYKKMLVIALPVTLQNFITSFLNMIDTVMVGKLGETEIAAVGIANQYFFLFIMLLIGLSAGSSVFIAQFWGKKDLENIKRIMGVGLSSAILVSLVFTVIGLLFPREVIALFNQDPQVITLGAGYLRIVLVSYIFTAVTFVYSFSLRSIGQAISPMVISAVALLINTFFNYMLIFGKFGAPALGVEGAALATVIARVVETMLLLAYIYSRKGVLAATLRELTDFNFEFVKKSYHTIFPVVLNEMCWGLASLVYVAVYGRMGTQAVAAIQICTTINNLFLIVAFGLASAAAVMVGNTIGAGEEQLSKDYAQRFSFLSVGAGVGLGLLLAVTSPAILSIFNVSDTVRQASQYIIYICSAIFFIRMLNINLIVGILRGGGDAKQAFIIEGFTMWFIGVPLTIVGAFVFQQPVYIVYALATIEEISKCLLCLLRLKSGLWIKNVTHHLAADRAAA
ncbi:MAG: MATE family efflux transporter [Clostridia bacterium]|nr:MATE family efflux transporter [Clostridia bacterium]